MEASVNYFSELYKVDVSKHIEKKGKFSYVSWPFAVAELKKRHPDATWEVCRFDGAPFMSTNAGVFVEVAVTVNGCTLSQIHPVLNGQNRPIAQPNAFDINTSIQRALVKAIALHGLGLFVYAGEDLPEGESQEPEAPPMISAEQAIEIDELIESTKSDRAGLLNWVSKNTNTNCADVSMIPNVAYVHVKKMLTKKAEKVTA
jgi:hypothetical protein